MAEHPAAVSLYFTRRPVLFNLQRCFQLLDHSCEGRWFNLSSAMALLSPRRELP